ncbi:MAG: alpha-amylase family glycosyl hydrolase, partial [Bacteroidota bacterium]|nr:alpha-amylase family glycosyl hydrolase [Bacteroidota bacterium]
DKAIVAFGKDDAGVEDLVRVAQEGLDTYGAHHLMGTITGNQDRPRFASLAEGTVRWEEDHKLAGWTRQIDRNGLRGHHAMRMLTAFNLSMPGVPCLYQGDEYADVGGNDPDNRRMVRFNALDADEADTRDHVAEWNQLRRSRMSLLYGQTTIEALPTGLLRIERQYLDETTTVYINPTPSPVAIDVMSEVVAGAVQDGELPAYGCAAIAGAS